MRLPYVLNQLNEAVFLIDPQTDRVVCANPNQSADSSPIETRLLGAAITRSARACARNSGGL